MSKYVTYYNARQEMYKALAINWSKFTKDVELTDDQRRGMALFFRPIARRFGLIGEFKNLSII